MQDGQQHTPLCGSVLVGGVAKSLHEMATYPNNRRICNCLPFPNSS